MFRNKKFRNLGPQVDIIPIVDISKKKKYLAKMQSASDMLRMPNIKFMTPPYDPQLMIRVKEYLAQHSEERQVDIVEMSDHLQTKYREYARRKRKAFQAYVQKAYEMLLHEYKNHQSAQDWTDEDDEDDDDDVIQNDGLNQMSSNHLNDGLMKMYQQKMIANSEPINITISSDDDEEPTDSVTIIKKVNDDVAKKEIGELKTNRIPEKNNRTYIPQRENNYESSRKRKFISSPPFSSSSAPKRKREVQYIEPKVTLKDVGGIDKIIEDIYKLLVHVKYPEIYLQIGITPPRGFLLHGPPGCGKTLLAHAIAGELSIPLLKVAAPELVAGVSGESEERIRNLFDQAVELAPCVLFIDEVDAITPNRQNAQREMERRIVAQLLSCLDALAEQQNGDSVIVIGATNRPDAIDPALRRAGRFDREIVMGIPNSDARENILRVLCKNLKMMDDFDFNKLAGLTPGFVGADLMSLVREAAMAAVDRVITDLKKQSTEPPKEPEPEKPKEIENGEKSDEPIEEPSKEKEVEKINESVEIVEVILPPKPEPLSRTDELITWLHDTVDLTEEQLINISVLTEDFSKALKSVQPSAKREGFATVPDVTWDDIGSLNEIRDELKLAILAPVRHSKQFELMGLTTATGVLLCGPPGCGKTLLAKAIANEAGINFISVKGPELLNMYVGESERAVRLCFQRARNSAPCVIFFDEIDALCPKRSDSGENGASMRVVNQMLTEMDGVEGRRGVFLMAASNRPEIVDPAVLRPGRFDKILYVGLPTATDRVDILKAITKNGTKPKMATDVDLTIIGSSEQCHGYTGADLAALVREASVLALKEYIIAEKKEEDQSIVVTTKHFELAINKIRPSVTDKDQKHYEKLRKLYSATQVSSSAAAAEEEIEDVQMDDA